MLHGFNVLVEISCKYKVHAGMEFHTYKKDPGFVPLWAMDD
jgi:hypothetical protein